MLNPSVFKHCDAVQKSDVVPFVATIGGMVSLGLAAEGIGIGCMTAVGMSAYNTMQEKIFNEQAYGTAATEPKMMALEVTASSDADDKDFLIVSGGLANTCGRAITHGLWIPVVLQLWCRNVTRKINN